ncbi:MAG: hypothetical protein J7527_18065 [Chitinophagaceae bacterium]|nr:hypothetical protein [Chitinophagaceae bacterium]
MKKNLLNFVKEPPAPWSNRVVIAGAGIIVSGWTLDNKVFLLSADGYSVSDPVSGERIIRNYDEDNTAFKKLSDDNLEFWIDELQQTIKTFGLRGGDGNHYIQNWRIESFTPSLGEMIIGIENFGNRKQTVEYWEQFDLISLTRLEYSALKYGFSPNEKHLGIFGTAGAEIFTRE